MTHLYKAMLIAAVLPLGIVVVFAAWLPACLFFSNQVYYVGFSDAFAVALMPGFAFLLLAPAFCYYKGSKLDQTQWSLKGLGLAYFVSWFLWPVVLFVISITCDWLGYW